MKTNKPNHFDTRKLGKHQIRVMAFLTKYPGWHTYTKEDTTRLTIARLHHRGMIEINGCRQMRLSKEWQFYNNL